MCGDAFFRDAMHFLGSNLHFKRLPGMYHRGVQRLIQIGTRDGNVILKPAGDGTPNVVNYPKCGVTVPFGIGDDPDRQQIVDLFDAALLALQLPV